MTSFMPPAERIWWKMPVGRQELMWIGIWAKGSVRQQLTDPFAAPAQAQWF